MIKNTIATVEIEGKQYRLAYDFGAICDVERESGGNLLHGLTYMEGMDATQFRGLLCAALRAANPKAKKPITVSQVAALLKYETIVPFSIALGESIMLSLPKTPKPANKQADEPEGEDVNGEPEGEEPRDLKDPECL